MNTNTINQEILKHYKPTSPAIQKVAKFIDAHDSFLLTTHIGSDADGVGSQIGLYYLLKALNKKCVIINNEKPPIVFDTINNDKIILDINDLDWAETVKSLNNVFTFILDSSELKRSAKVAEAFQEAKCLWATIDHHILPDEPNYCVDKTYAATSEMIWDLYQYYNIQLTEITASSLYIGIVADSGNFRYPNTSLRTHLAGGDMLSYGVNSEKIYRTLYESHSFDRLHLLKRILRKAILNKKIGYTLGEILPKTKKGLELSKDSDDGIVNQLLAVEGVKIACLLKRTKEKTLKCSLRSIDDIDVASIARKFNGGGHRNAAGCASNLPYKKAKKQIIQAIEEYLQNLKRS